MEEGRNVKIRSAEKRSERNWIPLHIDGSCVTRIRSSKLRKDEEIGCTGRESEGSEGVEDIEMS